jgi:hypothetical protein
MTNLLGKSTSISLVLAAVIVGVAPVPIAADAMVRIDGAFTVTYTRPSPVDYCGGAGAGHVSVEAQGIGRLAGLGPMFMTVRKCFTFADSSYAGTFILTAANGDTLTGTYAGTQNPRNENGFGPFQGTLTITGGTGRFDDARGAVTFEAIASPPAVGVTAGTVVGTAYYLVRGHTSR